MDSALDIRAEIMPDNINDSLLRKGASSAYLERGAACHFFR